MDNGVVKYSKYSKFNAGDKIKIRVKRSGMFQRITFTVVFEDMSIGMVKILKTDKKIDISELSRIADEFNLPVKDKENFAVPHSKKLVDFIVENKGNSLQCN